MSHILNLELSDSTFAAIQQQAKAVGMSPTHFVKALLEKQCRLDMLSEQEKQKARTRFERHFDEVDLGYPTGAENENIDEDLARAYADTHETS